MQKRPVNLKSYLEISDELMRYQAFLVQISEAAWEGQPAAVS